MATNEEIEITDPNELAEAEDLFSQGEVEITDPTELAEAENLFTAVTPQPRKQSYGNSLADTLKQTGLFASTMSAVGTGKFTDLRRKQDGNWELPILTPIKKDAGIIDKMGAAAVSVGQKFGASLDQAGPAIDKEAIQKTFHDFQQANNLSDDEMNGAWNDLWKSQKPWTADEKARVFSNGTVRLNPLSKDYFDDVKVEETLKEAGASPEARAEFMSQLPQTRADVAGDKLLAYEAAANVANSKATAAVAAAANPLALPALASAGAVESPSQYAAKKGYSPAEIATPSFIREYETEVLDKQGKVGATIRGLATDTMLGFNKVATTGLGIAGYLGNDAAGNTAAESSEAAGVIQQGKPDTGMVGTIVQEIPSVATQIVASQLTGGLSLLATGGRAAGAIGFTSAIANAGAQSLGLTYAQERADGKTHEEAQNKATVSALNTAVITGIFQGLGAGGVEKMAAGKSAAEITLRDVVRAGTRQEVWQNTRAFVGNILKDTTGEASEEAIDQFTSTFLNADPDSNLASVWNDTWEAFKVGGVLGGATAGVMAAGESFGPAPEAPSELEQLEAPIKVPFATPQERAVAELVTPEVQALAPASAAAAMATVPAEVLPTAPVAPTVPTAPIAPTPVDVNETPVRATQTDLMDTDAAQTPTLETVATVETPTAETTTPNGQSDTKVAETPTGTKEIPVDEKDKTSDNSHLDAILGRLGRERQRLAEATTEKERNFRQTQVTQAEKELADEYKFLGVELPQDDEALLAELGVGETPSPALKKSDLKTAFNLTDEQADAAVEVSRALGLSPERVLVEREFDEAMTPEPVVEVAPNITPEAEALLKKVAGGGVPMAVTPNLERIAKENGVVVTGATKPQEIIESLKNIAATPRTAPEATPPVTGTPTPARRVGGKLAQGRGKTTSLGDKLRTKPDLFTAVPKTEEIPTTAENHTQPDLLAAPRKRSLSSMRAEVVRKLDELEAEDLQDDGTRQSEKEMRLKGLLGATKKLVPYGYTKQGDLYVYTPTPAPKTFPKSFNKLATAPTREGIEKQIAKFYGGESKTLVPIEGRAGYYNVVGGRGVIDGVVVVEVARGWGFGTEKNTPTDTNAVGQQIDPAIRSRRVEKMFGPNFESMLKEAQDLFKRNNMPNRQETLRESLASLIANKGFGTKTDPKRAPMATQIANAMVEGKSNIVDKILLLEDISVAEFNKSDSWASTITSVGYEKDGRKYVHPRKPTPPPTDTTERFQAPTADPNASTPDQKKPTGRPQGAKGSAQLTPEGKALLKGLENPDFTTAVHEMAHAFEMTGYGSLTDTEVSTLKAWAGSKSKGRGMMETKASEKFARGWERYVAEGRAPMAHLQAMFDKMAKWMLDVYGSITNAEINIVISPEVRAIFDKLASRMIDPAAIVTPAGVEIHTEDGSALPPAIAPNEAAPPDMSVEDEMAGRLRHNIEYPKPRVIESGDDWNPDDLYSMQERRALEEAEQYDLNTDGWVQAKRTFGDLWDTVTSQPRGTGEAMLDRLVASGDLDRNLTDIDIATLTHEGLRRKVAVDEAAKELGTMIAQGASKELVAAKQSALGDAMARYQTIQNVAAKARTASGRGLNAWKYALRNDFSYATLRSHALNAYNSALIQDEQLPVTDLPADQKEKIRKYAEEQRSLQEEITRLRAAAETANPEAYLKRIAEQDALIAAMIEERKNSGKKSVITEVTQKILVDKVRQAAREARARLGIVDDGIRYQSAPNSANDPRWYDRVLVMAEPLIANPTMSAARFADLVLRQFGAAYEGVADLLRSDVEKQIRATLADISGKNVPSPEDVFSELSADEELTRQDVYALARAHVYEGARDFEVMDRVFADLTKIFPDLTKDQVTQLFTNYGEQQKLSPAEEAKALRTARSLELVQKQIDDLEARGQMKRTGLSKDDPSPELRALRKRRDDLAKEIGYVPTDPATGLSSAQGAARKRMANEIEELQKAIDSGERRVRVRRGVEYTEDMNVLREKLLALRDTYEKIFESERTPEERMRLMITDLDRRIAKERDLINKGIVKEEKAALPPLDSPEITARREALRELRNQKFAAYDLLHPNERSLNQAMKEAEDAVQRRQKLLDEGLRENPQKRQRGEGVNATAALQALWEAADALDVLISEIRRNRPLTPAQQQAQLDRAYAQAVASREALKTRIEKGDILAAPKTPKAVEERTRAIREENAAMRKQLIQMQKDAGVGAFSQEAREAKRVASLEARIEEMKRRRVEKDFSKKVVAKPVTNERIAQLELQLEYARFKFEEDRARDAFKGLKMSTKAIEVAMAAWHARQMFNLSGDFGIFGRQLGKVRTLILWEDAKALWKRARAGEPLNVKDGTILGKTLGAGLKVFLNTKKGDEFYANLVTSPRYAFLKANGLDLTRPHESSHELNSDGRVRVNPMTLFNNRLIGALMIGRGLIGTVAGVKVALYTGAPVWDAITKGIGNTLFGAGLAVGGVAFARRVEAAQVAMLNIARVGVTEAMLRVTEGLDPSAKEFASQEIVEAVMTLTGKLAGKGGFSKWLKNNSYMVGMFVQFPQYKYTNLKSAMGTPWWSAAFNAAKGKPGSKQTLAAVSTMMAHMYGGYAARVMMWAILLGVWDEDDEESTYGVVMNPNNPNFGKLKIGKTFVDLAPGWGTWFVDFARFGSDTKLNSEMLKEGYEIEEEKTSRDKRDVMFNFLMKQLPANLVTLNDIREGHFRTGGELEKMDAWNATDTVLSQIMMNLTARDIKKIYEEHDPATATALASLVMTGQNLNIRETAAEIAEREEEEKKRYTVDPE